MSTTDVIDTLAGIAPGSALDAIRAPAPAGARATRRRAIARCSSRTIAGDVTAAERFAVAAFVAGLHGEPADRGLLCRRAWPRPARSAELRDAIDAAIARGQGGRAPMAPIPPGR